MPGIFLSHSSADKPTVTRLAIDLVNEGIPVWFDSWELELGHSLSTRIFEGLDDSTTVLVLLSPNSVSSKWVQKEVDGALAKEERLGRTFILPIKIAECEIPLQLAGRIYADLSKNYRLSLEKLVEILRKRRVHALNLPPEQQLIPAVFSGVHLHKSTFLRRISEVRRLAGESYQFVGDQIVVSVDEKYEFLRAKLLAALDEFDRPDNFNPQLHEYAEDSYRTVLKFERGLLEGLAIIANLCKPPFGLVNPAESAYWFARIFKNVLLGTVYCAQLRDKPDLSEYGKDCDTSPMDSNTSARTFYEIQSIASIDIFEDQTGESMPIWIDGENSFGADLRGVQLGLRAIPAQIVEKFVIPQVVNRHVRGLTALLAAWPNLRVGLS